MKKTIMIAMLFGILSCGVVKKRLFKFKPYKNGIVYSFRVPKGYEEKRFSGDNEYQQEYWYSDSMVFYLTTFSNTINYDEIRKQGTYYKRFDALNNGDAITLSGVNKKGFHWKDELDNNGITIGYSNIHTDSLAKFEKMISSFKDDK